MRRRLRIQTPVLVLTALGALGDKRDAFGLGTDDYLVKPFALAEVAKVAEVAVRIAALHRRAIGATVEEVLRAGPLRLDRRAHEARVGERALRLTPMSMRLLERLLRELELFGHLLAKSALWIGPLAVSLLKSLNEPRCPGT